MSNDPTMAQARAMADQQLAHVTTVLNERVQVARGQLATRSATDVWAIIGTDILGQIDVVGQTEETGRAEQFAIEMLAAAIVRLAQSSAD